MFIAPSPSDKCRTKNFRNGLEMVEFYLLWSPNEEFSVTNVMNFFEENIGRQNSPFPKITYHNGGRGGGCVAPSSPGLNPGSAEIFL